MKNQAHIVAITGEPDEELERVGKDAFSLCNKTLKNVKAVGRFDVAEMKLEMSTALICPHCFAVAAQSFKLVTYLYAVLPSALADRVNADKFE